MIICGVSKVVACELWNQSIIAKEEEKILCCKDGLVAVVEKLNDGMIKKLNFNHFSYIIMWSLEFERG